jgi:hypothetical protein
MWFVLTAKLINVKTALLQVRRNVQSAKMAIITRVLLTNAMIVTISLMLPRVISAKVSTNALNAAMATASAPVKMRVFASLVIQATAQTVILKLECALNVNPAITKAQENARNA